MKFPNSKFQIPTSNRGRSLLRSGARGASAGQAIITAVVFFMVGTLIVVSGVFAPVFRDIRMLSELTDSKQSFALAEGLLEDVGYRIRNGETLSAFETLTYEETTASAEIANVTGGKEASVSGDTHERIRKLFAEFVEGTGVAFNFGVQSGEGGFELKNSASVTGNVFSNGTVVGAGNDIYGDVISAGPSGLVDMVHATGTAYAHTIQNSTVDKDAHYFNGNISNTTVGGTEYPDSPDQATSSLPISDATIAQWEQDAESGGIISSPCPYEIKSDQTIGPVKITCDLEIESSPTVTLEGVVWVTGDITIQNTATLRVASSIGGKSIPVIADDPNDPTGRGRITLQNKTTFEGSGDDGSYVLLLSQNTSAEAGGGTQAIQIQNQAVGDLLLYAGHGLIELQNNVSLKEVTGYRIVAQNTAEIIYESGLASSLFTTGPGGGFEITSWEPVE